MKKRLNKKAQDTGMSTGMKILIVLIMSIILMVLGFMIWRQAVLPILGG